MQRKYKLADHTVEAELMLKDSSISKSHAQMADTLAFLRDGNVPPAQLENITGFKAPTIRHYVRVSNKLEPVVMELLHDGKITFSMARALASFPEGEQEDKARSVLQKNTSVAEFRATNRENSIFTDGETRAHFERIARLASEQTGLDISIEPESNNKLNGSISIRYIGLDSFDAVCSQLGVDLSEL